MLGVKFEDRFVEVAGGRLFVRTWTPRVTEDDLPLVLLHDSLGCVELWRDFPEMLACHLYRPVIAYDRLGFGKSSARTELPSMNFIREEADVFFPAVRLALGITKFALFGHSVGGAMALILASLNVESCRAVVTEAAQVSVEDRTIAGIRLAAEGFKNPEQFARLSRWHGNKAAWVLKAWSEVWLSPAFETWSLESDLPQVRCPVLAIHGDRDEFGSVEFPRIICSGTGGPTEEAILAECGHVPHRERQPEVLDRVDHFLKWALASEHLKANPRQSQ